MSVSRKLEIFFSNMMRIAAYFDVRPIRIRRIASKDLALVDCSSAGRASSCSDLVSFQFPNIHPVSPERFRSFGANFLEFCARQTVHAFASLEWADLFTPEIRTRAIALIPIPCEFPLPTAPLAALGPCPTSGRPSCSPDPVPRSATFPAIKSNSHWLGAKPEAANWRCPANPLK